jgi:hypothetical protein
MDAIAQPLSEFYTGVRAAGMGNAFTAVADDPDALFYNPAGLALLDRFQFHMVNPKLEASQDAIRSVGTVRDVLNKLDVSTVEKMFGQYFEGSATIFPSLYFPNFAIGYYASVQGRVSSVNLALPSVEAEAFRDQGLIGGFGYEMRGFSPRHFLRVGAGLKWLSRRGFDKTLSITDLVVADRSLRRTLVEGPAKGFGATFGMQYEIPVTARDDLLFGSAWQDIGNTSFGNSVTDGTPPPIPNNLAAGVAFAHRFNKGLRNMNSITVSAEMRHLADGNLDPRLKTHLGAELSLGGLAIQAGVNQDMLTGGVSLDMGLIEVSAATYGVETQALAFMDRQRIYTLQATFKLDLMGKQYKTSREEDRRKHPRQYQ